MCKVVLSRKVQQLVEREPGDIYVKFVGHRGWCIVEAMSADPGYRILQTGFWTRRAAILSIQNKEYDYAV